MIWSSLLFIVTLMTQTDILVLLSNCRIYLPSYQSTSRNKNNQPINPSIQRRTSIDQRGKLLYQEPKFLRYYVRKWIYKETRFITKREVKKNEYAKKVGNELQMKVNFEDIERHSSSMQLMDVFSGKIRVPRKKSITN